MPRLYIGWVMVIIIIRIQKITVQTFVETLRATSPRPTVETRENVTGGRMRISSIYSCYPHKPPYRDRISLLTGFA